MKENERLIWTVTYSCDESGDTTVPLNYHTCQRTSVFGSSEEAHNFYSQCIGQRDIRQVAISYDDLCRAKYDVIDIDKLNY